MAKPLISPPEQAPSLPPGLTREQRIEVWLDWLDTCDEFLLAGLRRQVGPDGDLREAYRRWYAEQMAEHDRAMLHMVNEFNRRSQRHGG
jgi:hypothetical protein